MDTTNSLIEKAFLASIFVEPTILPTVTEIVEPSYFLEPRNEIIYQHVTNLYEQGKDTSVVNVVADLNRTGELEQAGGITYLREIMSPSEMHTLGADPIGLGQVIKEEAKIRELRVAGEKIVSGTLDRNGLDADEILSVAEQYILDIANKDAASSSSTTILDVLDEVISDIETAKERNANAVAGIPTGFPDFDKLTNGFKPGQMIIIAARPAVGKSTIAVDFARNAVFRAGKTVLFFSLEMDRKEVTHRILAAEALVESQKMKVGDLDDNDWMNLREAQSKLNHGSLIIDDNAKTSLSRVRSVATRQKYRPEGLHMVVIDYLGLLDIPSTSRSSTRQDDISRISRGLKLLAKELQVPIVVLAQLNRKSEERQDRKPMVSDLRESGSLEQDADMVLLLHRPETADPDNRPGETDLIIGKHRGGPTDTIPLVSMLAYCKFVPGQGKHSRGDDFFEKDSEGAIVYATGDDEVAW